MDIKVIGPPGVGGGSAVQSVEIGPFDDMSAEEFGQLVRSVMVVIPHRPSEGIRGSMFQNAMLWGSFHARGATLEDQFGGFIELTRANIAKTFLNYCKDHPDVDKLCLIDSDQDVPWDAPYRLARWDKPVVSGVICTANPNRGTFACFTVKDKFGVARFPSLRFTKTLPARGLREVHSVGTGLVCIKKDVFQAIFGAGDWPFKISESIRNQCVESGTLKEGEDISFSRQCEKLGFNRYVDFSVHGVHWKTMPIAWPKAAMDVGMNASEWQVDSKDHFHG